MQNKPCIFCNIINSKDTSPIVLRDDLIIVIRDLYPKAPKHLLIIPNKHITSLSIKTDEVSKILGHMFTMAGQIAIKEKVGQSGYRLIVNQGQDAGQEIEHLHMHLLGGTPLGPMREA
ncbi:HIT domain-containing protein [SAR202 cluster bacterium AC-409-J13_OGT_754m]|nr:HIT domain-containing protein [SAR202 cluster bacterium AC-409-J13_OGT_754m]